MVSVVLREIMKVCATRNCWFL